MGHNLIYCADDEDDCNTFTDILPISYVLVLSGLKKQELSPTYNLCECHVRCEFFLMKLVSNFQRWSWSYEV